MQAEIVVGLDIGTTKIAVIVGRRNEFGKIEVLGYGHTESIGVRRGVITNIENTVNSILAAVKDAQETSKVTIARKSSAPCCAGRRYMRSMR